MGQCSCLISLIEARLKEDPELRITTPTALLGQPADENTRTYYS